MSEQTNQISEQINQIKIVLDNLENKNFTLYFFTLDTKGNPTAGIANIYEHVKLLNELGYKAAILHEKNDYKLKADENGSGIADWLGEEYAALPHVSIEGQQLNVSPADFIIVPDVFSNIMDQIKAFPCKKIVFAQSYDYIFELLPIGKRWNVDYGFNDVITTSVKQAQYLSGLFPSINTHVVPVSIPSYFKPSDKPKMPVIAIHTRNPAETTKLVKSFYLQYPIYKFCSFKDLHGLSRQQFANELGKSCCLIWVDNVSSFGTAPLEAIECNTPVIGLIPNMVPEWMIENKDGVESIKNNGVWTNSIIEVPSILAQFMKTWFEDALPSEITNGIKESQGKYTSEKQKDILSNVYFGLLENRKIEMNNMLTNLESQLPKLVETTNA